MKTKSWLFVPILLLLAACTPMGAATNAEAFGQGYASITEVATSTSEELATGRITADQAAEVDRKLQAAYNGLVLGEAALTAGQTGSATAQLDMVIALLTQLEKSLPKEVPSE